MTPRPGPAPIERPAFLHPERAGGRSLRLAALILLFLLGALLWAWILNFGDLRLTAHDWPRQYMYLSVERQALETGVLPWRVSRYLYGTDAFPAIPEIILSPQILLLRRLPPGRFVLMNVLLLYAAGYLGLLLLRRRYAMPAPAFIFLFLIFNFNGHIVSHLAVGHQWYGYFLLPFFCLLVLRTADGEARVSHAVGLAFVLLGMYLNASFHLAAWCLIFLALLFLFCRAARRTVLQAALLWAGLAAFRLLPGLVALYGGGYTFRNGYPSLYDLLLALVSLRGYDAPRLGGLAGEEGWWEYNAYIGLGALAALLFLGVVVRRLRSWRLEGLRYETLDLPLAGMFLFSLSYFYAVIAWLPIPFANVERVSSRFLIIPLVFLLVLACARAREGLDRLKERPGLRALVAIGLAQTAFSLVNHAALWNVGALERIEHAFIAADMDIRIVARPWAAPESALVAGAAVSVLTALGIAAFFILRRVQAGGASQESGARDSRNGRV